jgi:hypothetical protein
VAIVASTIWINSICAIGENISLKSIPSTHVNLLITKQALCFGTKPLALYLILKIHLQFTDIWLGGRGVSIQVLLSYEDLTQNPWFFSNVMNLHHSKPPQQNGAHQYQQNKYEAFTSSLP